MSRFILAYGSLRHNGSWFKDLANTSKDIRFIETIDVKGFKLYGVKDPEDKDSYQDWIIAEHTGNPDDIIKADVIEMSEEVYNTVLKVINVSNFRPINIHITGSHSCKIFLYNYKAKESDLIKSGDYYTFMSQNISLVTA